MTYEQAIQKLEGILSQLKTGQMPLAELTEKIKEAQALVAFCKKQIKDVSEETEKLLDKE